MNSAQRAETCRELLEAWHSQRFVARVRNDERVRYIPIGLFDGSEIVAGLLGGDYRFPLREGGSYRE